MKKIILGFVLTVSLGIAGSYDYPQAYSGAVLSSGGKHSSYKNAVFSVSELVRLAETYQKQVGLGRYWSFNEYLSKCLGYDPFVADNAIEGVDRIYGTAWRTHGCGGELLWNTDDKEHAYHCYLQTLDGTQWNVDSTQLYQIKILTKDDIEKIHKAHKTYKEFWQEDTNNIKKMKADIELALKDIEEGKYFALCP